MRAKIQTVMDTPAMEARDFKACWPRLKTILAIATVLLVTNYLFANRFGLYEDDYIWVNTLWPMSAPFSEVFNILKAAGINWVAYEGRPLYFLSDLLMAYMGGKAPSLALSYFIGYLIFLINASLLFFITRKILPYAGALFATLAYITFTPDGSKVILMHRPLHLSMTCLLLGLLLYQHRFYVLAYLMAAACLLTYESFYLPFIAAPFLVPSFEKSPAKRILVHCVLFFAIAGFMLFLRSAQGDTRTTLITGGFGAALPRIMMACVIGPLTCVRSFFSAPINGLAHTTWTFCLLSALTCLAVWSIARAELKPQREPLEAARTSTPYRQYIWVLLGGLLALSFAYCLAFRAEYFPPTTTLGRLSGVQVGAAFGWSIAIGAIVSMLTEKLRRFRGIMWFVLFAYLGLAVNYGLTIQERDYVTSWQQQKNFWRELISLSSNFGDGDIILVDKRTAPFTPGFPMDGALACDYYEALARFVKFPKEWKNPPRVYGIDLAHPTDAYDFDDPEGGLRLHEPFWAPVRDFPIVRDRNFFYFRYVNGELMPSSDPIVFYGRTFQPKAIDFTKCPAFRATRPYRVILGRAEDGEKP